MKIEVIEIAGFASAMKALHLPFGKGENGTLDADYSFYDDMRLPYDELQLNFSSESNCEIEPKDIELLTKLVKAGDEHAKVLRGIVVWMKITAPVYIWCEMECYRAGHERLCSESTMHIDCHGLSGEELVKAKSEIPMGKELTKIDFFSYQCLRNIYKQRRHHRLPEWHAFCDWIKELPFAEQLITCGID